MATQFVVVGDAKVRVPEGDYSERLYRIEDPPEDFKIDFDFDLADGVQVNHGARFVVAYMIDPSSGADMPYQVRLNNVQIKNGHATAGVARGMWEIVQTDLLRESPQHNTLEFRALPNLDSRGFLNFSDIVVWYKSR
jgi:hypothetical protein